MESTKKKKYCTCKQYEYSVLLDFNQALEFVSLIYWKINIKIISYPEPNIFDGKYQESKWFKLIATYR